MLIIFLGLLWGELWASLVPIKDKVPPELTLVFSTLQGHPHYQSSKKEIDSLVQALDKSFSSIAPKEVSFIIKSELLQTLLTSPPTSKYSLANLSEKMVDKLSNFARETSSPFWIWFISALREDLREIVASPNFSNFQKNKKDRSIKKKLALILPWYNYLAKHPPLNWDEAVFPLLIKCLKEIAIKSTLYASLVPPQKQSPYFEEEKVMPKETEKSSIVTVAEEVIEEHRPVQLPLPVDDWKDTLPIVKFPNNPKGPMGLPIPTDDWITAEDLPRPVDDWPLQQ